MPEAPAEQEGSSRRRPARALLGWVSAEEARLLFGGRRAEAPIDERSRRRFEAARRAVQGRKQGVDQAGAVGPLAEPIDDHLELFWASEHAQAFRKEGWNVGSVDLRKLCAFQPSVFLDHAEQRTSGASAGDFHALARITLPLTNETEPTIQFDHVQKAWIISSDDPNLEVVGHFSRPISGGRGCGFLVAAPPSCMQVVRWQGRYFLKDGYHRALGFLRRGVYHVPSLVLDLPGERGLELGTGELSRSAVCGARPPLLTDYLDDGVAVEVELPDARRMVVVQALTLNPLS